MSKKSCPAYPVKGFIISGDPTTAVSVSGCSKLLATETSTSGVEAPGSTSRLATSALKTCPIKPIGDRNPSLVQRGSSKPGTSKAPKVRMGLVPVKIPASGAGEVAKTQSATKPGSLVPNTVQKDHAKNDSMIPVAPPSTSTAAKTDSPRHRKQSKRAFTSKRSAYKIISRFGEKPTDELTEQEKNSLRWAKTLIEGLKSDPPNAGVGSPKRTASSAAPKRQRSEEDTLPGTKRSKHMPPRPQPRSYKEVAKDHLIWAIIDRNSSDGTISSSNWKLVVMALNGVFLKVVRDNPGPPPQCEDAGWYQGHIKLIACTDERSAQLYKTAIESLGEVWSGAKLEAIPLADVPQRPRSIAKIPAIPSDPKEILEIMQVSNPQLPTKDWKIAKVTEAVEGSRKATVIINSDSLSPLRKTQGKIYYGFGTIFLRVYKGDDKEKPQAPESKDSSKDLSISCDDESALSSDIDDTQSVSGLVGEFFDKMDVAEDEDALLESDDGSEDADVTVVHSDQPH